MRRQVFNTNTHYYLSNTGVDNIFRDAEDYSRFIFLLLHLQSPTPIYNVGWYSKNFPVKKAFRVGAGKVKAIIGDKNIEPLAFAVLPNSFGVIIKNIDEGIASVYMHRVSTGYSKYFNSKYGKSGHVFVGPFKSILLRSGSEISNFSAFLHREPASLKGWERKYGEYPWSSLQDHLSINRWGSLLAVEKALKQFKNQAEYKVFVEKFDPAKLKIPRPL